MRHSPARVLFVGHSASQGGAELCLDTLLRHLDRERYAPYAVFPHDGPMARSARGLDVPVQILPLCWWMYQPHSAWYYGNLLSLSLANVYRLVGLIRRLRIDVVYTNTIAIFESAVAARIARVPHIWHCHEVMHDVKREPRVLPIRFNKKLIAKLSDRIIFESESSRRAFEGGAVLGKTQVVYNSARFPAEPDDPATQGRARLALTDGDVAVGFVGQFIERKDPLLLLRAIPLMKNRTRVKLVFVGAGPLREELFETAAELGLGEQCRFIDFQPDVRWVIGALDVLALPSREESFGLVLVEAGALGKPVVATCVEGPSEIVVDGETGFLIEPGNHVDLAGRLDVLCSDSLRRQMGEAARRRVSHMFSPTKNTRQIEHVIQQLLNDRKQTVTLRTRRTGLNIRACAAV